MSRRQNHRWATREEFPLAHKTERSCLNGCGITKVTRHETEGGRDIYWTEFWRDGEQMQGIRTPRCEPVEAPAAE